MNRRDTIIIAVLINAGLLAILFMMAIHPDDTSTYAPSSLPLAEAPKVEEASSPYASSNISYVQTIPTDEVDNAIKAFVNSPSQEIALAESIPTYMPAPEPKTATSEDGYTEIKVKRGDFLEKIARAHGTTIKAIMQANGLSSERLNVGQILRIPPPTKPIETVAETPKTNFPQEKKNSSTGEESPYYIVQRGDNPWKIAKKFQVGFEDLLILNDLDEEKARNLKVGDKLRVR
ncbi:LysM peptidoglycan-binding domain-containing protein [Parachlamydia sp. AcF125]|uniref:muramidase family protein n=1 Tax=Parachlamydia sp. AcF125 TaxID=2795736 RepID=UPI001BCA1AF5|nr:LysM peptidoglycan-binding domain-containing protein [Parachlamydia sp. AcF125]MBS4169006.1 Peptidoglycan endopeptidase LytF [Parachlamydia sp. AcF125]